MTTKPQKDWSRLSITNDISYLPIVSAYIRGIAEHLNFSEENIYKIELAVEEAVANVLEHAFLPDEIASFDISCRKLPEGIEVVIHDQGLPHDPTQHIEYSPHKVDEDMPDKGLGSFLMRELMDEFEYRNLGAKGKDTRFVKYFDSDSPIPGKKDFQPEFPEPVKTPVEKINYTIRLMKPAEAIEICRCVYDSYGYSYANEHIYYPDRVAAMNESGDLKSAVVVSDTGEIGGHFALIFYDRLPAEIGIAVTKKKFRGQNVAGRLAAFLDEQAIDAGLKGLQIREVTVHPYTQKFARKLGYVDCGYLLAHSPNTVSFKGIADELSFRNTDIVGFKYFETPEDKKIYAPPRHWEIIKKLYNDMGVSVEQAEDGSLEFREEKTVSDVNINSVRSVCEIHFPVYGKDIKDELKQQLRTMRQNEIKVVEMYLSLTDPMTPMVFEEAERLGYFFTGILPETAEGDSVVLQYFNGIQMDYDAPVIEYDSAKELLAYIRELDPHHK